MRKAKKNIMGDKKGTRINMGAQEYGSYTPIRSQEHRVKTMGHGVLHQLPPPYAVENIEFFSRFLYGDKKIRLQKISV